MAEGPDVSAILRRAVQANASFYKGWVDLSVDYWRRVGEIFGVDVPAGLETGLDAAEAAAEDAADNGVLVLEGDVGTTARGAFLVTNDLGRVIKCELVASGLSGPQGAQMSARVRFDPPSLELAPGEQCVVHALIPVDDQLAPGAAYTGSVAIRGMDGFSVPFVLRRTHSIAEAERAAAGATQTPSGEKPAGRPKQKGADVKPAGRKTPSKQATANKTANAPAKRRARQKK